MQAFSFNNLDVVEDIKDDDDLEGKSSGKDSILSKSQSSESTKSKLKKASQMSSIHNVMKHSSLLLDVVEEDSDGADDEDGESTQRKTGSKQGVDKTSKDKKDGNDTDE